MKYKVEIEIDFNKRPSKKTVLNSLFDMLRDNKVNYKLYKYNNSLYKKVKRSINNDKYK
mgnify:CR=1 FL=1|tara:strand:- start:500 stop:676 length:177 start_codon:yes stop_codon:yes gene_type:complete